MLEWIVILHEREVDRPTAKRSQFDVPYGLHDGSLRILNVT